MQAVALLARGPKGGDEGAANDRRQRETNKAIREKREREEREREAPNEAN